MYQWNTRITTLKPLSLGLDDFFKFAESFPIDFEEPKFPSYNILKPTDSTWLIEMALAGYSKQDIDIEHKDGVLTVSHKKPKATDIKQPKVLHQGITKKSFAKQFAVAETVIVKSATFTDGLLSIELEEILPEEKKAKKIQIS
jgi:molecular chaperone IbpA